MHSRHVRRVVYHISSTWRRIIYNSKREMSHY